MVKKKEHLRGAQEEPSEEYTYMDPIPSELYIDQKTGKAHLIPGSPGFRMTKRPPTNAYLYPPVPLYSSTTPFAPVEPNNEWGPDYVAPPPFPPEET